MYYKSKFTLSDWERTEITLSSPSKDRAILRSKTFPGIAKCMAETWAK